MLAAQKKNVEAFVKGAIAGASTVTAAPNVITAAGAGDATKVTGETIDRLGYDSCAFLVSWFVSLTATKTLSFAAEIQESSDASSWDTAVDLYTATVVATATGASKGVKETVIDLSGRKRYFRVNITPDLSHSGTDVAVYAATAVLGGANFLPAA